MINSIDEKDAYFAGLLFADGSFVNLNKNWRTSIFLGLTNKKMVESFSDWVGASKITKTVYKNKNHSTRFDASKANSNVFNFLDKHGVVSKVQVSYRMAQNENFWRGFIDGDGCISVHKPNNTVIGNFHATNNSPVILYQLKYFADFLNNCTVRPDKNSYQIGTHSNSAAKFIIKIYKDASIFLPEKMKVARRAASLLCSNHLHIPEGTE